MTARTGYSVCVPARLTAFRAAAAWIIFAPVLVLGAREVAEGGRAEQAGARRPGPTLALSSGLLATLGSVAASSRWTTARGVPARAVHAVQMAVTKDGKPAFLHGRDLRGQLRRTLGEGHSQRLELAALDEG